ncbi:MAG TPA: NAD(P)-dependent oxidoreductase [Gemmatimonadales bacterium]|jgi:nucleoside-diphosphate-sugar epimerase
MQTVVTGGAGFIGSHLVDALVRRGDRVVCVERPGAVAHWIPTDHVDFRATGIADPALLVEVFGGTDVIFHLAGLTCARRPEEFDRVNVEGTANVLRAAAMLDPAPHVVFLSSLAATGPCQNGERLNPSSVPYPLSAYGRSKLQAEAVTHAFADRVPITVVRLPAVYGPRERGILAMFRLINRGIAITFGGWDRELSLIYVTDVVQGLLRCTEVRRTVGHTYILSHPEPVTWRAFAWAVAHALGRSPLLISIPKMAGAIIGTLVECGAGITRHAAIVNRDKIREMAQERWVCDPSASERDLGFAAAYSVPRGVAETAAWYQEARWL